MSVIARVLGSVFDVPGLFAIIVAFLRDKLDAAARKRKTEDQQAVVENVVHEQQTVQPVTTPNTVDTKEIEKRLRDGSF